MPCHLTVLVPLVLLLFSSGPSRPSFRVVSELFCDVSTSLDFGHSCSLFFSPSVGIRVLGLSLCVRTFLCILLDGSAAKDSMVTPPSFLFLSVFLGYRWLARCS